MTDDNTIEIPKSAMESYEISWDQYLGKHYIIIKVVRVFKKKGTVGQRKFKGRVTLPSFDQALPEEEMEEQRQAMIKKWEEIKAAVDKLLENPPEPERVSF